MSEATEKLAYTIQEAAQATGVHKATIWKRVKEGDLTTFKWCGRTLIRARVLNDFLNRPQAPEKLWCVEKQEAEAKAAAAPKCGVYLLMQKGSTVYVGRSTDLRTRLAEHRRSGRGHDDVRIIECDAAAADWLEAELIRVLEPSQNLMRYQRRAKLAERALQRLELK